MKDNTATRHGIGHDAPVTDGAADERDAIAASVEVGLEPVGQVIDYADLCPSGNKCVNEMGSDEACAPCHADGDSLVAP